MRCGGGRDYRIGRTEKSVEKLLVLLDSSIAEIFVNDGELVFTTMNLSGNQRTQAAGYRKRLGAGWK